MPSSVILLTTSVPSNVAVESNQREVKSWLAALRVDYVEVDGANADNAARRSALWAAPGATRAAYPSVFVDSGGGTRCIGNFEQLKELQEAGELASRLS